MLSITNWLKDHPTAIAGLGLLGLAAYQASTGDYQAALHSALLALGAWGVHLGQVEMSKK